MSIRFLYIISFWIIFLGVGQGRAVAQAGLELSETNNFYNCNEFSINFQISVTNGSNAALFQEGTYGIDWGDGTAPSVNKSYAEISALRHTYTKGGDFRLKFSAKALDGSSVSKEYTVRNLVKPSLGLGGGQTVTACINGTSIITVIDYEGNSDLTRYRIEFGDGTGGEVYTQQQLLNKGGTVTHTYSKSSCPNKDGFLYQVRATYDACDISETKLGYYKVVVPPTADFSFDDKVCVNTPIDLINKSSGGQDGSCTGKMKSEWYIDGVGPIENLPSDFSFSTAGPHTIKLVVSNGPDCSKDSLTKDLNVAEAAFVDFEVGADTACVNEEVQLTSGATGFLSHRWVIDPRDGVRYVSGTQEDKNPVVAFLRCGSYRVQLYVEDRCARKSEDTTIIVREDPVVALAAFDTLCPGTTLDLSNRTVSYDWKCSEQKANWELSMPDGRKETANNVIYPNFRVEGKGDYMLKVTIQGTKCSREQVVAEQKISVHDTAFRRDITVSATEICYGNTVQFTSNSSAKRLTYHWDVPIDAFAEFQESTTASPSPKIKFPLGGKTYTVTAYLSAICGQAWNKSFPIKVKRNPEAKIILDPAICPGEIDFSNNDITQYKWYGNEEKATWEVIPDDPALSDGYVFARWDAKHIYPVIDFRKPGVYTIKVTLKAAGCPDGDIITQVKTRVYNNSKTLQISASNGTEQVCVNEVVVFTNTSSAEEADIMTYKWSVTPSEGWSYKAGGETAPSPAIQFTAGGTYQVTGSIRTCDQKDTTITIKVKKNPEVTLVDVIDPLCPGIYDFHQFVEKYEWFGNRQDLLWQITGDVELRPGSTTGSLYPVVDLKKGTHTITVRLNDVETKCVDDMGKFLVSRTFKVYDSLLTVNIVPSGVDVCENDEVEFVNNTNHGDAAVPSYEWQVDKAGGHAFVGGEDSKKIPQPSIHFSTWDSYLVSVKITSEGGCKVKNAAFPIKVRGIPAVDFKTLPNMCNGTNLVMNRDRINYTPNNCDLTYRWQVDPDAGTGIDDKTKDYPVISFTQGGRYDVKVEVEGQCGGKRLYTQPLNVLDVGVNAIVSASEEHGCTDLKVDFGSDSHGDSLSCLWTIVPRSGWYFDGSQDTSRRPTIVFKESGNYKVLLKTENICAWDTASVYIQAYSVPVIVSATPLIKEVCEKGYVFKGKDEITIDDQNDQINRVKWTITPGGYSFVAPTSDVSSYPDLTFTHGDYHLKGEYWNRCGNGGTVELDVSVDEFISIDPKLVDDSVCHRSPAFELTATPAPGIWSSENGMVENRSGAYYYVPKLPGDFEVVYAFRNGGCIDRDTMNVHVYALPVVNAGVDTGICINHEPRQLVAIEPVNGGWWDGTGVAGDMFVPDAEGGRFLYYHFQDPRTGCVNQDSLIMTVWGLPDTTFYSDPQYCMKSDAEFRPREVNAGNSFDWTFGDGESGTSTGNITHMYQEPGFRYVTMVAISNHGCRDTSADRLVEIVKVAPPADFAIDNMTGCGPHEVNISVDTATYNDKNLLFAWDFGNGVRTDSLMPPNPLIYVSGVWDTVYTIDFEVYNLVCPKREDTKIQKQITVFSSPAASFSKMHEWECAPMEVVFKNSSTGNRNVYKWYFGDGDSSIVRHPKHLYLSDSVTRVYDVMLIATNNCASDTFVDPLIVKTQSIKAFFETPKRDICVGEEICFKNVSSDDSLYIINTRWDFGDNSKDTLWSPCHGYSSDGRYKILLYIDNGCGFDTISDRITVHPLPKLGIESEDFLCENESFHFELKSDLPLQRQEWDLGDLTTSAYAVLEHQYEGFGIRHVKVWAIASSIGSCRGEAVKDIVIHPVPRVRISPLDTAVCPPFLYRPEISGEGFLMWDYGDGTELTSSVEHLYENETDEVIKRPTKVYAESDKGCKSEYTGEITVYNVPRAHIDYEMITKGKPQVVEFINLSEMYDDCIWYLPFDKVVHSFDNQRLSFDETELYTISLVAANRYGCSDSAYVNYQVVMRGLFFPNTFIPQNDDPEVGRFNGKGIGLSEYRLEIYDQRGNLVWRTEALQNGHPSEGWDGKNKKGELMPQGVYIWRAKATFIDGSEWTGKNGDAGVPQTMQGTFMLLKQ